MPGSNLPLLMSIGGSVRWGSLVEVNFGVKLSVLAAMLRFGGKSINY